MATEAEEHVGEANSINVVKDNGNIKVEDSEGLNATEAKEAMLDDIKNEEIEQVNSSEPSITDVVEIPENTKVESEFATLVPEIEADVKEVKDQVNESNVVELPNGLADVPAEVSMPELDQELKSEATKESTYPEAVVEEVKCTEEPSPIEVYENIPETDLNEVATSDAIAQEVKTTEINNIEESTPLESFQNVPESAAKELSLLDATVAEIENTDALLTNSSQAEEISENVLEPYMTETAEDTQVTDSTATEEVQKNLPESSASESSVSTTEKKETLITESSKTLIVTENVLETAVPETPVEVPKVPEESLSIVVNADTTVQASEVISKASGDAEKVEEKKENSLGKLFMQENEVVAEEPKITTTNGTVRDIEKADEKTTLVQSSRDDVDNMVSEKTRKYAEKTEESSELSKAEFQVKSSNQKSNNIFSKMKQSIVKAKKAIIGKSPSSKAMDMESRDDIKL